MGPICSNIWPHRRSDLGTAESDQNSTRANPGLAAALPPVGNPDGGTIEKPLRTGCSRLDRSTRDPARAGDAH